MHPGGALTACGCVFEAMAIRADGAMTPGTMLSHLEMGRINRDDLTEVWQDYPLMRAIRERRPKIPFIFICILSGLILYYFCTGYCPGVAYELTGAVHHPSPDACFKRFLGAGGVLPKIR